MYNIDQESIEKLTKIYNLQNQLQVIGIPNIKIMSASITLLEQILQSIQEINKNNQPNQNIQNISIVKEGK